MFKELLKIVPNLEARIMTGSEEELANIADQVSTIPIVRLHAVVLLCSFAKEHQAPGAMTRKASKVAY